MPLLSSHVLYFTSEHEYHIGVCIDQLEKYYAKSWQKEKNIEMVIHITKILFRAERMLKMAQQQ